MKRTGWWIALSAAGWLALSCYGPDTAVGPADTDTDTTVGTGNEEADLDSDATGSSADEGPLDTTSGPDDCMPGVFGQSQFGEACFQ